MSSIEVVRGEAVRIQCSRRTGARWRRSLAALLVGGAFLGGGWWYADRDAERAGNAAAASAAATVPAEFRSYRGTGFTIDHPASWRPEAITDGVLFRIGGQDAVSVKRTTLARPVSGRNVADMRAVTDAVLTAPEVGINVLRAAPTTLGGLPGMHYLYTFTADGVRGAHTHWFAFSGRTMFTVVFQALPDTRFAVLAPVFDKVAASFRAVES
jgi:hypothetical protein